MTWSASLLIRSALAELSRLASWVSSWAEQHRVPLICPYRQFVLGGGLMSYGPDSVDIFRRSSSYVDRILKGERAGNLPVAIMRFLGVS